MNDSRASFPLTLLAGGAALVVVIVLVVLSSGAPESTSPQARQRAMTSVAEAPAGAAGTARAKGARQPGGDATHGAASAAPAGAGGDGQGEAKQAAPGQRGAGLDSGAAVGSPNLDDDEAASATAPPTIDAEGEGAVERGQTPSVPIPAAAARTLLDGAQLAGDVGELKGRLLRCVVDAVALPDRLPRPLGPDLTRERLRAYCRGRLGGSHLLEIGFNPDTVDALPAVGRGAEVIVQLLDVSPTGAPQARYLRVDAGERRPLARLRGLPDLFAAWLRPIHGQPIDCVSAGPVELLGRGAAEAKQIRRAQRKAKKTDKAATERPAGGQAGVLARVRCVDRRDVAFPVLVRFPRGLDALRVDEGTSLRLAVHGSARGQLLAQSVRLLAGAAPVDPSDLRRVLVTPKRYVGTRLRCTSMGVPPPQAGAEQHPPGTSPRWAWVVCAQRRAPPVHLRLFFATTRVADLLSVVRNTVLEADVVGARASHVDAVFRSVIRDGASPEDQLADLRRYVLLNDELKGKPLTCELLFDVAVPPPAPDRPNATLWLAVTCKDPARPNRGQPFDLRFDEPPAPALLRRGRALQVALDGLRHGRPRARFVAASPAKPDRP